MGKHRRQGKLPATRRERMEQAIQLAKLASAVIKIINAAHELGLI